MAPITSIADDGASGLQTTLLEPGQRMVPLIYEPGRLFALISGLVQASHPDSDLPRHCDRLDGRRGKVKDKEPDTCYWVAMDEAICGTGGGKFGNRLHRGEDCRSNVAQKAMQEVAEVLNGYPAVPCRIETLSTQRHNWGSGPDAIKRVLEDHGCKNPIEVGNVNVGPLVSIMFSFASCSGPAGIIISEATLPPDYSSEATLPPERRSDGLTNGYPL